MSEQELRTLIREAVARHMGRPAAPDFSESLPKRAASSAMPHPSHGIYLTVVNSSDACVIEPSVACDHCGYCKSHGH